MVSITILVILLTFVASPTTSRRLLTASIVVSSLVEPSNVTMIIVSLFLFNFSVTWVGNISIGISVSVASAILTTALTPSIFLISFSRSNIFLLLELSTITKA